MEKYSKRAFIINSNAIEGYIGPDFLPGSLHYDNHEHAYNFMLENSKDKPMNDVLICTGHSLLMRGLLDEQRGVLRVSGVQVGGHVCPKPIFLPNLMYRFSQLAKKAKTVEDCWNAHYAFETIHPFIDGNGRMGRIVLNCMLDKLGLTKVVVPGDDKKYEYYTAINKWRKRYFYRFRSSPIK